MANLIFPTLALLASSLFPAHAESVCKSDALGREGLPDAISIESVSRAIGYRADSCGLMMKKWPHQKDTYIAYAETDSGFEVYAITKSGNSLKLQAKFQHPHEEGEKNVRAFDFARYQITKSSTAIGIRFNAKPLSCTVDKGFLDSHVLLLLELKGNSMREVLRTPVWILEDLRTSGTEEDINHYPYSFELTGILMVGKPGKSGYNSLIKKVTRLETGTGGEVEKTVHQVVFTWRNGKYFGKDIVSATDCPIPLER